MLISISVQLLRVSGFKAFRKASLTDNVATVAGQKTLSESVFWINSVISPWCLVYILYIFMCLRTDINPSLCVNLFLILSVICTAFPQCHRNCVCVCHRRKITFLLTYDTYFWYTTSLVFLLCKKAFNILLICTKKVDTTNTSSIAIVNEAIC